MKQSLKDKIINLKIVPKPKHPIDVLPAQNEREQTLYEAGYDDGYNAGFKNARQHLLAHLASFIDEFCTYVQKILEENN